MLANYSRLENRYLNSPVGFIDLTEVNVDIMQAAYKAGKLNFVFSPYMWKCILCKFSFKATPSLEIMGTEENHVFMKMAGVVIDMRKTLATGFYPLECLIDYYLL